MDIGSRVRILPHANYKDRFAGCVGEIVYMSGLASGRVGVKISGHINPNSKYGCFWFDVDQFELLESEEKVMLPNYKTASIRFLNGNTDSTFHYALYDAEVKPGDTVVVKTGHHGLSVAEVVEIDAGNAASVKFGREIVARVDFSAYEARKDRAKKIAELKRQMDAKVEELQQEAIYEMLAEQDAGLAKLLADYRMLIETDK